MPGLAFGRGSGVPRTVGRAARAALGVLEPTSGMVAANGLMPPGGGLVVPLLNCVPPQ